MPSGSDERPARQHRKRSPAPNLQMPSLTVPGTVSQFTETVMICFKQLDFETKTVGFPQDLRTEKE